LNCHHVILNTNILNTNILNTHMSYEYYIKKLQKSRYIIFYKSGNQYVSTKDFLALLQTDLSFIGVVNDSIMAIPLTAYYYESPPINNANISKPYFFVAVETKFKSINANKSTFDEHFKKCRDHVVSFLNLSKDAELVVPCPEKGSIEGVTLWEKFLYLKKYIINASEDSKNQFWKKIGLISAKMIDQGNTIYLKTHGHGVPYIHFRIQTTPKYYAVDELFDEKSAQIFYDLLKT